MVYKYVSLGMHLGGSNGGKISYLHDGCATHLNSTLGPNAEKTTESPPPGAKCPWCGEILVPARKEE